MGRLTDEQRKIFDNAVYLPMLMTLLERDRKVVENAPFKIKQVYLNLIEHTMKQIHKDMRENTSTMYKNKWKVVKGSNDGVFTEYNFYFGGYHEVHNLFNANLKNNTEKLLNYYFMRDHLS